jgi:DNA-binding LacI/PurR family transcriptional regulator
MLARSGGRFVKESERSVKPRSADAKTDDPKMKAVTLKAVAARVGLTAGTVSAVLNNSAASRSVPEHTKKRILAAARALNYQPNHFARSLRMKRTYTIGVIAVEIGDAYGSMLISGIEQYLRKQNFFFLTVAHRHDKKLLETYSQLLIQRGVEGLISIDTQIGDAPKLPTVAIAGHGHTAGVINVVLDQRRAAELALRHLVELGHREIAFMKGSPYSSDTESRWKAVCDVAHDLGLKMRPELIVELEGFDPSPQLGYPPGKKLVAQKRPFTALFAYNDISAIGAIHAIQEAGLRVPEDISVVGLDDIEIAVHYTPSLTTVRQPLQKMGEVAARALIEQLEGNSRESQDILVEPELVVRKSTSPVRSQT